MSALDKQELRERMLATEHEFSDGSVKRTSDRVQRCLQWWMKLLSNQPGVGKGCNNALVYAQHILRFRKNFSGV
jgi:hypothetical protein